MRVFNYNKEGQRIGKIDFKVQTAEVFGYNTPMSLEKLKEDCFTYLHAWWECEIALKCCQLV